MATRKKCVLALGSFLHARTRIGACVWTEGVASAATATACLGLFDGGTCLSTFSSSLEQDSLVVEVLVLLGLGPRLLLALDSHGDVEQSETIVRFVRRREETREPVEPARMQMTG